VPPGPIRRLRTHTRYRRHLTQARTAEKQRVEKLLEGGHLKLSSVISDIHGVSGRDMLDAIAAGQRDPRVLAQLARGKMRGKIRRLEEALDCSFFTAGHAAVLALAATGNSALTIIHALLSDPAARYTDLGADYYEQRMHTRRQARNHVRGLERLGYQVTIQAINPDTGELLAPAG
jgi:hypothetical protein